MVTNKRRQAKQTRRQVAEEEAELAQQAYKDAIEAERVGKLALAAVARSAHAKMLAAYSAVGPLARAEAERLVRVPLPIRTAENQARIAVVHARERVVDAIARTQTAFARTQREKDPANERNDKRLLEQCQIDQLQAEQGLEKLRWAHDKAKAKLLEAFGEVE